MLMEDDNQGDLDHEAATIVEGEEGSSNTACGKGTAATEGRRAAECTIIAEEGSSSVKRETAAGNLRSEGSLLAMNKEDGSKRSLLAVLLPPHRPNLGPMPKLDLGSMSANSLAPSWQVPDTLGKLLTHSWRVPNRIVLTSARCLDLTLANPLM
ncbi:hypothetical protein BHM03_00026142 [Ensete ventricosum]|nr:hypothetical protein BHM03_00026142 [Ensete ventricosum]